MKRQLTLMGIFFLCMPSFAQERVLSFYDDTYLIAGPSLRGDPLDVKFQMSFKVYPVTVSEKWQLFFTYAQTSVWYTFRKSSPFKDNIFRPGVFFENRPDSLNTIRIGYEHRSNGRPYSGNPLASPEVEDYSRVINYVSASWIHDFNAKWQMHLTGRVGFGVGVGEYPRHESLFTQDIFAYYLGYVDAAVRYSDGRFRLGTSVTPIWNRSIANVTLDCAYRFNPKWPALFVQFHYGYDEAMCDCTPGVTPPLNVRIGVKL